MTVSGCITINLGTPAPTVLPTPTFTPTPTSVPTPTATPTPTPEPTATPMPTPTPTPVDSIVGFWVGDIGTNSIVFEFFQNGTYNYYVNGSFKMVNNWSKINDFVYMVDIGKGGGNPVITLNEEMTAFTGLDGTDYFLKTSTPPPLYRYSTGVVG